MKKCYYCECELNTVNESVEHIIPNSIGGRLKSKKLLCKSCNSFLGTTIDAPMAAQINPIAGFLMIKREKGEIPPVKNVRSESGKIYHLENGRTPVPVAPEIDINLTENRIHITARDEKEMRNIIAKLKKKYPGLDTENLESKMISRKEYMDEALMMSLSVNNLFIKGIIKIAVNAYLHQFSITENVLERIRDLKNDEEIGTDIVHHYYPKHLMQFRKKDEVNHTIIIKGDPEKKLLYAFVEIFSSYAFIVKLNTNYIDEFIQWEYTYDILNNNEIETRKGFEYEGLNGDLSLLNNEYLENLKKKISNVMAIGDKRQSDDIISRITKDAVNKTIGRLPEGTLITESGLREFIDAVTKEAAPFIFHMNNKNKRE